MTTTKIVIALGVITCIGGIIIHYRFRQAHFEMWVSQFEDVLGEKVPQEDIDSILKDIFTEHEISISRAIILYKEAKSPIELGEGIWDTIEKNACRTEVLTIEEVIKIYDLTEEQIKKLRENRNNA